MTGRRSLALAVVLAAAVVAALSAGAARAADECKGLRVCLPVAGPWVVVPAGGTDYELACPVQGLIQTKVVCGDASPITNGSISVHETPQPLPRRTPTLVPVATCTPL